MGATTYVMIAVIVVLALMVAIVTRRRRDRSLQPVRLGPSWSPTGTSSGRRTAQAATDVLGDDDRVADLCARTGHDEETVATVVLAYDELLSVLGVSPLPADHHYRVYDAYDPPVVGRDAEYRPIPDPVRIARDVEQRTRIGQDVARQIIDALLHEHAAPRRDE